MTSISNPLSLPNAKTMTMSRLAVYRVTLTVIGSSTSRYTSALGMRGTAGTAVSNHVAQILPSDRCLAYTPREVEYPSRSPYIAQYRSQSGHQSSTERNLHLKSSHLSFLLLYSRRQHGPPCPHREEPRGHRLFQDPLPHPMVR